MKKLKIFSICFVLLLSSCTGFDYVKHVKQTPYRINQDTTLTIEQLANTLAGVNGEVNYVFFQGKTDNLFDRINVVEVYISSPENGDFIIQYAVNINTKFVAQGYTSINGKPVTEYDFYLKVTQILFK